MERVLTRQRPTPWEQHPLRKAYGGCGFDSAFRGSVVLWSTPGWDKDDRHRTTYVLVRRPRGKIGFVMWDSGGCNCNSNMFRYHKSLLGWKRAVLHTVRWWKDLATLEKKLLLDTLAGTDSGVLGVIRENWDVIESSAKS